MLLANRIDDLSVHDDLGSDPLLAKSVNYVSSLETTRFYISLLYKKVVSWGLNVLNLAAETRLPLHIMEV